MRGRQEVSSGFPQECVVEPVLFNIFIHNLDIEIESFRIRLADDKNGELGKTWEDRNEIQQGQV